MKVRAPLPSELCAALRDDGSPCGDLADYEHVSPEERPGVRACSSCFERSRRGEPVSFVEKPGLLVSFGSAARFRPLRKKSTATP